MSTITPCNYKAFLKSCSYSSHTLSRPLAHRNMVFKSYVAHKLCYLTETWKGYCIYIDNLPTSNKIFDWA